MMVNDYIYPSAKIRALEPQILDDTDIERMVDAPDFEGAFKVLNDTDYADNLLEVEPINYRDALRDDFKQVYKLLKTIIPDKRVWKLIYLHRDFVNAKLLLKAKFFNIDNVDDLLSEDTVYPPERLKEYIFKNNDLGLDPQIRMVINEAMAEVEKKTEPSFIDTFLTKKYFGLIKDLAQEINNQFIIDLVKIQINNANIISWIRAKRLNIDKNNASELFIPGGSLSPELLSNHYNNDVKELKSLIAPYYDEIVLEYFDKFIETDSLFEFEKTLADFEIRHCKKAKIIAFGPEVPVAYFFAKKAAIQNIRMIMTGKLNNINSEEIKKTIRQTY